MFSGVSLPVVLCQVYESVRRDRYLVGETLVNHIAPAAITAEARAHGAE